MATERETITQKVSKTLFILGAFNLIILLEGKKENQKKELEGAFLSIR